MRRLALLLALAALLTPVASAGGWTLTLDPGVRAPEGVSPAAVAWPDGSTRLYLMAAAAGIHVYRSTDGLSFALLSGGPILPGSDPSLIQLPDGSWRAYFVRQTPDGSGKELLSALSSDGLSWRVESGVRFELGFGPAVGVPQAVALPDGRVRVYWVQGRPGLEVISSATSSDGLAFAEDGGARTTGGYVDPAVARLADGSWLLVASTSPADPPQRLVAFTSRDGLSFTKATDPLLLLPAGANALDPTLLPLGGDRFRVYFSTSAAGAALTGPYVVESGVLAAAAAVPAAPAPKKKTPPLCRKGQRSTAKHPCRRR